MTEQVAASFQDRPGSLGRWWKAIRVYSFTASMVPVVLGALLAIGTEGARWDLLPFVILASLFLHIGTNLVNDYYDYDLGLDHEGALGGSGVLVSGELTARQIGRASVVSFVLAVLLGVPIILARGWPVLGLGLAGLLGGALYTAKPVQYKYWGAGDLLVFLLMGPLMVMGSHFALTGNWGSAAIFVSLPVGLLVTAILHANNLRDLELDAEFELKTLAIRLGRSRSVAYLNLLLASSYLLVILAVVMRILPSAVLAVFLSGPLAIKLGKGASGLSPGAVEPDIVRLSAALHLLFGVLLGAGLVAARYLPAS